MTLFDFLKPRTAKGEIKKRERELMAKLVKLMEIDDEETFRAGLAEEFGITPEHPRYKQIMDAWRDG